MRLPYKPCQARAEIVVAGWARGVGVFTLKRDPITNIPCCHRITSRSALYEQIRRLIVIELGLDCFDLAWGADDLRRLHDSIAKPSIPIVVSTSPRRDPIVHSGWRQRIDI